MKKALAVSAAILLCLGVAAQADVFNMDPGLTNLEMVTVGDPGNQPDGTYGSVGYNYKIGKYEVTTAQYTAFLNAVAATDTYGLYTGNIQRSGSDGSYTYSVAADWANRPVNSISYWDACRFANWLHNGQPTGLQRWLTTEDGAYTIHGYNSTDGRTIQRNAGAKWFLPSEDEWYKAAYYKGGGTNVGYWDYPTQSDSVPSNDLIDPDPGNNANYQDADYNYTIGYPYYRTNVGEFENSESAYGTFDQGGNIMEWNETIERIGSIDPPPFPPEGYIYRVLRGGSFVYEVYNMNIRASDRYSDIPFVAPYNYGFRVAEVIPEPTSFLALFCGLAGLGGVFFRRRPPSPRLPTSSA